MALVKLTRIGSGNYSTEDGRWKIEHAAEGEWNGNWTVWDTQTETHADGKPFQFATKRDAEQWLADHVD